MIKIALMVIFVSQLAHGKDVLSEVKQVESETIVINGMIYKERYLECLVDKDRRVKSLIKSLAKSTGKSVKEIEKEGFKTIDRGEKCVNY